MFEGDVQFSGEFAYNGDVGMLGYREEQSFGVLVYDSELVDCRRAFLVRAADDGIGCLVVVFPVDQDAGMSMGPMVASSGVAPLQ